MIYAIITLSILFAGLGFLLTENNARYLLAGYNTMPEEEREKTDIKSYIPFFRKFHLWLGLSFLALGVPLALINKNAGSIFLAVYPVAAYAFFLWKSRKFYKEVYSGWKSIGVFVSLGVLFVVGILLFFGLREDSLIIKKDALELEGFYGETLPVSDIKSIELTEELPEVTFRANGFALGNVRKGYFRTRDAGQVKLLLNSREEPYIMVKKESGEAIYYSSKESSENIKLYKEIKETWPGVVYAGNN